MLRSGEMWCNVDNMVTWHVPGAIGWRQLLAPFRHDDSWITRVELSKLDSLPSET
jgi:hypothetical protein